jgi:hypothetical protein
MTNSISCRFIDLVWIYGMYNKRMNEWTNNHDPKVQAGIYRPWHRLTSELLSLPDDKNRDGSWNVDLLTIQPPSTAASLRKFHWVMKFLSRMSDGSFPDRNVVNTFIGCHTDNWKAQASQVRHKSGNTVSGRTLLAMPHKQWLWVHFVLMDGLWKLFFLGGYHAVRSPLQWQCYKCLQLCLPTIWLLNATEETRQGSKFIFSLD